MHRAYHLPVGDFPDVSRFRGTMEGHDLSKFPKLDSRFIDQMDAVLERDIPKLMAMFPQVKPPPCDRHVTTTQAYGHVPQVKAPPCDRHVTTTVQPPRNHHATTHVTTAV